LVGCLAERSERQGSGNQPKIYDFDGWSGSYYEWGRVVTIEAGNNDARAIANLNPIRYRGYYYDTETGYYYLQSRYYDPEICRFINFDYFEVAGISKDEKSGLNLFIYCSNDPVNYTDYLGFKSVQYTKKLNDAMCSNAKKLYWYSRSRIDNALSNKNYLVAKLKLYAAMTDTIYYFLESVKTGGQWNLKSAWGLKNPPKNSYKYIYDSYGHRYILRFDDPGNIHFGYVGYVLFPKYFLCAGAGVYQIISGTSKWSYRFSYFDDPRDTKMIKMGFNIAETKRTSRILTYLPYALNEYYRKYHRRINIKYF
jgi:RHS repeat-associated protein